MRKIFFLFALAFAASANASTITFEIPGEFVGKGCGTGGIGTACGTFNGQAGYLEGGLWQLLSVPQGAQLVGGRGDSTVTSWLAPSGDHWVCFGGACSSVTWKPAAIGSGTDLGGRVAGRAAVNGVALSGAPPSSDIFAYSYYGWAGAVFDPDGVSSSAVTFGPSGILKYQTCKSGSCVITAGDGQYLGGYDGEDAVLWTPSGVMTLGPGFVTSIMGEYVSLSSGLAGRIGGSLAPICLNPECTRTVADPYVVTETGKFIGSGSLVVGQLQQSASQIPEPSTIFMFLAGGALIAASRHRRRD